MIIRGMVDVIDKVLYERPQKLAEENKMLLEVRGRN